MPNDENTKDYDERMAKIKDKARVGFESIERETDSLLLRFAKLKYSGLAAYGILLAVFIAGVLFAKIIL